MARYVFITGGVVSSLGKGLASAALAGACHWVFEEPVWPSGAIEWAAVAGLGIGPLGAAFGPVLRLAGQPSSGNTGGSELSLQRYLDRVTAVRLRLQQMTQSADANALARQMAQSLFQGKGSDLADTQAYARLMAASLGAEWAGMGETLFVRPVVQAEQSVLQPAQASLNEAWRRSIALPWQRAFAGRYPFAATANDASLPELARYIRPQSGLINTFLLAELAGVLALQGDQWVPVGSGTGLTFDPAFLKSINTLQRIGAHLLVQGEPRYQFELRPIPTPGLTDTRLTLDRQTLHYYNQRETWQAMSWPVANLQEPRTLLQWQTERAGTNKTLEIEGVWAWVRMLEHARVTPIDSATVQLTFHARPDTGDTSPGMAKPKPETAEPPDSAASLLPRAERVAAPATLVHPIHYQMRTAVGRGPLEALELRDLRLPERIFVDRAAVPARPLNSGSSTLRPRPNGFQRSRDGGHDSDVVSAFSSSSNTRAVAPLAASENSRSSQRPIRITTTAHSAIARLNSVNTCTRRICPSERDVSRDWTLTRPAASRSATSAAVSPVIPAAPVNPTPVPLSGADGCADAGEGEAMAQNLPSRRGAGHPTWG